MLRMQPKPIQLTDWHRILAGGTPWAFLLEVVLRAGFTYLLLLVAMRLLGKRVAAQLTLFELSMVVTMAAVIGIPSQVPDKGLLPALAVLLAVLILLQRALDYCEHCGEPRWTEAVMEAGRAQPSRRDSTGLMRKAG